MYSPHIVEPVTKSDILGLATWNRKRTNEELQSLIARRSSAHDDLEQFASEI